MSGEGDLEHSTLSGDRDLSEPCLNLVRVSSSVGVCFLKKSGEGNCSNSIMSEKTHCVLASRFI